MKTVNPTKPQNKGTSLDNKKTTYGQKNGHFTQKEKP